MSKFRNTRLVAVSETGVRTAMIADVYASDPADLRPLRTGHRPLITRPDPTRRDLPDTSVVTVRKAS